MRILADPNIPCVSETFSGLGEIRLKAGREWTHADVMQAEVLLVRSVTRVDQALLEDSPVTFVGSATAGIDHVDTDYLTKTGIRFSHAPGSNADSVVEYVLSSLFALLEDSDECLTDKTVGIIGVGQVGSRLVRRLEAMGVRCLLNDPPRQAAGDRLSFVGIDEILQADVISLHVPLIRATEYPTQNLLNADRIAGLRADTILINSARGGVVDEQALLRRLEQRDDVRLVIDCWENEPMISHELLQRAEISTPHIAGYSHDAKLRATRMLYRALCGFLETSVLPGLAEPPPGPRLRLEANGETQQSLLAEAVFSCYDVREDCAHLKQMLTMQESESKQWFDSLRKNYPLRREFSAFTIAAHDLSDRACSGLGELGFLIEK